LEVGVYKSISYLHKVTW